MIKYKNEIYSLVDEKFLSEFDGSHREFMKKIYYNKYIDICGCIGCKIASYDVFFVNMHRRRIRLIQQCCPYCGKIDIIPNDKRINKEDDLGYCGNCGHSSASNTLFKHLSRFIRIYGIVEEGLIVERKKNKDKEDWILGYDCYQMELIELASIIEVVCREIFYALLFIKNMIINNSYFKMIVSKSVGNDFMNIEKANNHFKKAFDLDLKSIIDKKIWNDLIDIVNLRNMMIHNNGRVDDKFKNSISYNRLKANVDEWMYRLDHNMVMDYFDSVMRSTQAIVKIYLEQYRIYRNTVIDNYYFNHI